ncbi:uncharacterized protein KQ657_001986 [Scheffersomyces spartinae]|uniref:DUF726-domain-containing protein n=1 Tax=Scheffersomyces spartinae TaxID=45513 RepID=A0A9P8AH28_9ASCO|nr:uncharacterized protein KQ657_001986 [Scheffersomyces spartinae]KAG7192268.1 hypothetical protein KQ657_001986 [Scheffersomyces spartinae]
MLPLLPDTARPDLQYETGNESEDDSFLAEPTESHQDLNYVEFDFTKQNNQSNSSLNRAMSFMQSSDSLVTQLRNTTTLNSVSSTRNSISSPGMARSLSPVQKKVHTTAIKENHDDEDVDPVKATANDKVSTDVDEEDDFFNDKDTAWKHIKQITEFDYYNDRGDLEFKGETTDPFLENLAMTTGYTRIDTEEQVAKYLELDRKTDFLFKDTVPDKVAQYQDMEYNSDDDSGYHDEAINSSDTLESTRQMLTENQQFAYVAATKLITVEMATNLAKIKLPASSKYSSQFNLGQRNFANWTMYVMLKMYEHMKCSEEEQAMIEKLSVHGIEIDPLLDSLRNDPHQVPATLRKNKKYHWSKEAPYDLRWVIVCDLFLLLLSDGYFDSRSKTLLLTFAQYLGLRELEILQFERRLTSSLDIETNNKSIENDDEKLIDKILIDKQIKKNKKKRLAYIGMATLGGGLAIGLSAGLLAPVIGAGLAAGLTTIGITGSGGFLAGVGGGAIITTAGIAIGANVGAKAGSRRAGDVHTFEFKPLHNNKRAQLILTVSGWMNSDLDDVRLPFSTVDPVMGDIFSLLWEPEMLRSMGQTIGILASEALSTSIQQILGATILTSLMAAIQLPMILSKLSYLLDNPWNVSLDRAWKAGKILADNLSEGNLGIRPITLVGFSLGSRLIYSCLTELARRGIYGLVENVIILGSPVTVNVDQLSLARSVVSGRFINGYSKKDWILGYLFRATSGGLMTVAGLSPIENVYGIENIDCTEFVEGHMAYRQAIPKILKELDWEVLSETFAEIEEPDPEQVERQRKLVDEFEEAKQKMEQDIENGKYKKKSWKFWTKPSKKNWWDTVGNTATTKNTEEATSTESNDTGATVPNRETEEYQVETETETETESGALFDIDALKNEIKDIEATTQKAHH